MQYGGYGGGDMPPMGGPGVHPVREDFPCVRLRGLPFDATEEDVRMFLVRKMDGRSYSRCVWSNDLVPMASDAMQCRPSIPSTFFWSELTGD